MGMLLECNLSGILIRGGAPMRPRARGYPVRSITYENTILFGNAPFKMFKIRQPFK